jgi:MFS family permease
LTVGFALAATWLAAGLQEPPRPLEAQRGMGGTIVEALRIVRGNRQLLALIVFAASLWTLSALVYLYAQAVLAERGLPTAQIGVVLGLTTLITAVGAWLAGRLSSLRSLRFWIVASAAGIAGSGLLLAGAPLIVAVAGLFVVELFGGALEPMIAQRVNDVIASAQRATILSVESFLYSVTMIWAFPLFGFTAERWGWLPAYAAAAGILLVFLAVYLVVGSVRPARARATLG